MNLWRVALQPATGCSRARPRWLCSDGRFSLTPEKAWTVVDPATAGRRLQQWLALRGHAPARLHRFQLVSCAAARQRRS